MEREWGGRIQRRLLLARMPLGRPVAVAPGRLGGVLEVNGVLRAVEADGVAKLRTGGFTSFGSPKENPAPVEEEDAAGAGKLRVAAELSGAAAVVLKASPPEAVEAGAGKENPVEVTAVVVTVVAVPPVEAPKTKADEEVVAVAAVEGVPKTNGVPVLVAVVAVVCVEGVPKTNGEAEVVGTVGGMKGRAEPAVAPVVVVSAFALAAASSSSRRRTDSRMEWRKEGLRGCFGEAKCRWRWRHLRALWSSRGEEALSWPVRCGVGGVAGAWT